LLHEIWILFKKDLIQEFRSKAAINAIFLFSVVTLTAVSYSIGSSAISNNVLAALLWIVIVFSALSAFSHIFLKEEEAQTADTLKLIAQPTPIFLSKLLFNILLLTLLLIVIVPLFIAAFNFEVKNIPLLLLSLFLGDLGLASGGTIVAALIAKASKRGALFSVLSFPILLPVMIVGISAAQMAFTQADSPIFPSEITALFAYDVVLFTAALMLFDFIWND